MTYVSLGWILGEERGVVWSGAERGKRAIADEDCGGLV